MAKHGSISRRMFLGAGAASGVALLASRWPSVMSAAPGPNVISSNSSPAWVEATLPQLQEMMTSGQLRSRELTRGYIDRIASLNPLLHAVIEINPNALSIAASLDNERRKGKVRGSMHGIPILVKDNVATKDNMQTTAGSLALVNSGVPDDAVVVRRLIEAGAIILGKANMGEWANFRGFNPLGFYGWSARGGITRNPYLLSYMTLGSSSGSGVATAASLCAASVGTETDGSIVGPSNANLVVGLKPTLGLISQQGIIPISHMQDTAGPIGRTVTDVATLLSVLQSPFGAVSGSQVPTDYSQFLHRGALDGARIGVDRRFFDYYDVYGFPGDQDVIPYVQNALDTMVQLGATLVDTDTGDYYSTYYGDEFTALLFEIKAHLTEYLATLSHTSIRDMADLIDFNQRHCPEELAYYGQELFEIADSTDGLDNPAYLSARANAFARARAGIDDAIAKDHLDAIVAPHLSNSTGPAVSGYPNLALPVGITAAGKPVGILMYSTFLQEPKLLALAYDLEQALNARHQPQFLGTISDPPNTGICESLPKKPHIFTGKNFLPHGRFFI
jgi:amidase